MLPKHPSSTSATANQSRTGAFNEGKWVGIAPRRLLKQKELAAVFGIDERHLRRLQNVDRLIAPILRPGSCRIVGYAAEEVAKLAALRAKQGKAFCQEAAASFGYLPFLRAVSDAALQEGARNEPARFGELRLELLIDVLAHGQSSLLAAQMGITAAEIPAYAAMAQTILQQVLRESPGTREALAAQIQAALIGIAVHGGRQPPLSSLPPKPDSPS